MSSPYLGCCDLFQAGLAQDIEKVRPGRTVPIFWERLSDYLQRELRCQSKNPPCFRPSILVAPKLRICVAEADVGPRIVGLSCPQGIGSFLVLSHVIVSQANTGNLPDD